MGLLDIVTGGKSDEAGDALKRAEAYIGGVKTPTVRELTLPELQKYVEMGIITPSQAEAYLQKSNAYADENIDQTGTAAQIEALNRLRNVASAGPEGTPLEQAQVENSLQQMRTADQGGIGAIEQGMAARGTPYALIQAALSDQVRGQNAQQAHSDAVNAHAAAYQAALQAMSQGGALGGQLQSQQNAQANTVAGAANAMQQFNAANQQNASEANANRSQDANRMNLANKQQVANNNVGLANTRTEYNANLPQQVFQNEMGKAGAMAGAATNYGSLEQQQGQQNAGLTSGLINLGTSFIPGAGAAKAAYSASNPTEAAFANQYNTGGYAHGGIVDGEICMAEGGAVPGDASISGDSLMNDTVHANLSPGEAVIPRSSVAQNPEIVSSLMGDQDPGPQIDFQDVATLLKALRSLRMGSA